MEASTQHSLFLTDGAGSSLDRSNLSRVEQDERDLDDLARLAEECAAQVEREAAEIRRVAVPIETEPPTTFRP